MTKPKSKKKPDQLAPHEQNLLRVLWEFEQNNGRFEGIGLEDLQRSVQIRDWSRIKPLLEGLGDKALIEMHKGPNYEGWWPPHFDSHGFGPVIERLGCDAWEFRLTESGQKWCAKQKWPESKVNADAEGVTEALVTLDEFLQKHCEPSLPKNRRTSIRKAIQNAANRGVIELPKHANNWASGKAKQYREGDLLSKWSEYANAVTVLPPLEAQSKAS